MPVRLYDTLTRTKREVTPDASGLVSMYVCGPTVYGRAHIGNARPAVVFDTLRRLLRHVHGPDKVVYARNITDIDDKIIAKAAEEGVPIDVITRRYEDFYLADMGALGVEPPDLAPHATDYVGQMVAMIGALVAKGAAYAAEGHVLFDVTADAGYGALSKRTLDQMQAGARVEVAPYKRNPGDFVLWKPSTDDQPGWESPWGRGRPGWHIECSAMIEAELGTTVSIHGGGLDLIFPHHENELAQSRCAHDGAPLADIWMHNGFLSMGGSDKMSKSLGNVVGVDELLAEWHPEVVRLALLSAHYRQPLEWTDELLRQSRTRLDRMYQLIADAYDEGVETPSSFLELLGDDLNTPAALAWLGDTDNWVETMPDGSVYPTARRLGEVRAAGRLLGLFSVGYFAWQSAKIRTTETAGEREAIDAQIAARTAARAASNFAEADRIRDELAAQGIVLEDGPGGTTWRRA